MIVRTLLASLLAVASSTVQVAQPGYWDELYAESLRMNVTDFHHSWQGVNFEKLAQVLGDRLQLREDLIVLVLGSGDSLLPEEIHQKGVAEVIAMDLSPQLSRARPPGVRSLMEDARSQTSLEASSVDVIIELGLLDVILAEADVEGAAALLREARRLLCAGGLFISGSTDIPKFRQPLLAEHPAGGWAEAEVLRLDRPLALDRRVKELDPSWEVDRIFIYLNVAAGEVEVGQALRASRTEAATAAAPPPTAEAAAPSPEAATPPAAPVEAAAPSPEAAAPPAAPVEAAAPLPEAVAPPAAPVEAAAPAPEAVAPPAAPVEAAAPSPEAAAPPAAPVEAAAPSPEAAAPPAAPVEAAAPSPEAAAPPAAPVEAAVPSPEAAAPPAAPVEAAAPSLEAVAPPAAPVEAAAPASSPKSRVEDPAAAFAESIRRLQAQAAALAKP